MQNEVWGCEEILTSFILFLTDNMEGGNQGTVRKDEEQKQCTHAESSTTAKT